MLAKYDISYYSVFLSYVNLRFASIQLAAGWEKKIGY